MLKRTNLIWEVPCHICLPKMHTLHPLPLLCSILQDRKIKDNQERTCARKRSFEDLRRQELDREGGEGGSGLLTNMGLLLLPKYVPIKREFVPR